MPIDHGASFSLHGRCFTTVDTKNDAHGFLRSPSAPYTFSAIKHNYIPITRFEKPRRLLNKINYGSIWCKEDDFVDGMGMIFSCPFNARSSKNRPTQWKVCYVIYRHESRLSSVPSKRLLIRYWNFVDGSLFEVFLSFLIFVHINSHKLVVSSGHVHECYQK